MDSLARVHLMHGFLKTHGGRKGHGGGSHIHHHRSASCSDKHGLISPSKSAAVGHMITPMPGRHGLKKLHDMTVCLQVMDYDRFSRDEPMGETILPMKDVKFEKQPVYWKHLQKPTVRKVVHDRVGHASFAAALNEQTRPHNERNVFNPKKKIPERYYAHNNTIRVYKGEIMISMCYLPNSNRMTVVVVKAKDLPAKDMIGTSDPYVKLWLVQQGNKLEKRKTTVKAQCLAPVYNESFAFCVPPLERLKGEVQLVATVMDHDVLSSNDEIGHVIIGSKGSDSGIKHWREMLENPEHPTAMWHKLSPKW